MTLETVQIAHGATLAPDNIPLHFGDTRREYHAALETAVLMNRSHEGRIELVGDDRAAFLHRMSTNDLLNMAVDEGRPTIFTNPNARILDRAIVYNREGRLLLLTEPGRAQALLDYLQRQIFFNDKVRLHDVTESTRQFALHGPQADAVMAALIPNATDVPPLCGVATTIADVPVFVARRKPISESHWVVVVPFEHAAAVWTTLLEEGEPHGLVPAGSLIYNTLRIRAGRPAGRELSTEYIPLEVGLWDEISFTKGCYTGQEIIARMDSRNRLAKAMVRLILRAPLDAPTTLFHEGRVVGTLTSSVITPDDEHLGLGVVKFDVADVGVILSAGEGGVEAEIVARAGTLPPQLVGEETH
ncbi:MAG: glycine cleavage system protein T [Chloroflexi bacterium]|nr:MAG: glycine cleavage system protein T [Phototrophicales bacterium]RMF81948.1 MAG: glycine cleavage system protein T [Chloroflexota bacterium]